MDLDDILIEEVRNYAILYDLGQADYKNLKKKEQAWREVASKVKLNEVECKKRWKGLRDSYKRCKRIQQIASGSKAQTRKRKWRYFDQMNFLDNVQSYRPTIGSLTFNEYGDNLPDIIEIDSVDTCCSPASQSSTSLGTKKKNDSKKFQQFLDLAASNITETCETFAKMTEEDSTTKLFSSLAKKNR